ncbi:AraC family transcriptional regulator [Desulfovibrio sp. JC010]|uniref:AraC family transcriptional regulator n=1 Tax=Desulfovibrio sp. JC010 TaxID=2593641 RepID=UPI0013D6C9E7|nr:AraC family transcriptional regulator [Desulfovibrio sp. JC010]NDV27757.1 AraC family transcriptional regulator [Desulfovibrio sp. JC010]
MREFNYTRHNDLTVLSAKFDKFEYRKHSHEEYAIGVTLTGIQKYWLEGEMLQSGPGGVMLFHPEQLHDGCSGDKSGLEYVMSYIPRQLFEEVSGQKDVLKFSSPIIYDRKLAENIVRLTRSIEAGHGELLVSELIMSVVNSSANINDELRTPKNFKAISRAIEIMHDNFEAPLKLDEICKEVQMSKFHFIRQFKAIKGLSPYQFFLGRRIEQAKKYLDEGKELYDVMLECGFYDLSHFNRQFKSVYGLTAHAYIKLLRKSG